MTVSGLVERNPGRTMRTTEAARRVAVALMLVVGFAVLPGTAHATHRPGPCHLHRIVDEPTPHYVKRLIRCATDRWIVPGGADKAICIARRESGLDPTATSKTGEFLGLYQHMASVWPDRYETWTFAAWELRANALNGRTNTVVTMRMVNANGWGPWAGVGC
jgi:hypothetical protein